MEVRNNNYAPAPWSWDYSEDEEFLLDGQNNIVDIRGVNKLLIAMAPQMYELILMSLKPDMTFAKYKSKAADLISPISAYRDLSYKITHKDGSDLLKLLNCENAFTFYLDRFELNTDNPEKEFIDSKLINERIKGFEGIHWMTSFKIDDSGLIEFTIDGKDKNDKSIISSTYEVTITPNPNN